MSGVARALLAALGLLALFGVRYPIKMLPVLLFEPHGPAADRWYEVVGVVGNLPVSTDARVAYHAVAPGQIILRTCSFA